VGALERRYKPDSTRETRESHPLFRKSVLRGKEGNCPSAKRNPGVGFEKIAVRDRQIGPRVDFSRKGWT